MTDGSVMFAMVSARIASTPGTLRQARYIWLS